MTHDNLDQGSEASKSVARKLILADGVPGKDDAGHCIARRLGGLNDLNNLFPQNCRVNRVKFRNFEAKIYKILKDNKNWKAKIEVQLHYDPNHKKPRRPRKYSYLSIFYQKRTYKKRERKTFANTVPRYPCK